jgi:transposase
VQQAIHGHRGHKGDPLYAARRTLHTGADLLTDKHKNRLVDLFAVDEHVEVEATWRTYQPMIAAYREPDRKQGRTLMGQFIASLSSGVPTALTEIVTLGRTLKQCAADVLAYFERPGTANGPTEASTAASSTSAAPRSASATSPTTSPDPCSTPAASGPDYTLDHEEPHNGS